ncbi:MAG: SusC/RagA family TonB-linked outer membrane protein [Ginsengibacter sp.]
MKLVMIFMVAGFLQVSAKLPAQNISISGKNLSLKKVFKEIKQQAGYVFFYDAALLKKANAVSINVSNATIEATLNEAFKNQPLTWSIQEKTVTVIERPVLSAPIDENIIENKLPYLNGMVKDEDGNPLSGVSVVVKGSTNGGITNAKGEYHISNVEPNATIVFSFIGYMSQIIKVNGRTSINVSLKLDIKQQNEVVIIGYGSVKKKDLTGSVSIVSAKDIEDVPFNTVDNALAGKAAGVQVTKADGTPGGAVRIRVRGSSSLLGGNDPLYVIDGVPLQIQSNFVNPGYSLSSPMGAAVSGGISTVVSNVAISGLSSSFISGLNSLGGLNPDDIESITILKDASSTAIYGSKAANGVVIITTKRGKIDTKPVISASYYTTISSQYKTPHLLNANQYKSLLTESAQNQVSYDSVSGNPISTNADLILNNPSSFFGTANTDWVNAVTRSTISQNAEVSVQGGSKYSKYFSSISYTNSPGIVKATNFQRISGKINLENDINSKLQFITNVILGYTNQNIGDNAYTQALSARPDLSPYDSAGNYLNFNNNGQQYSAFTNPVALLSATNNAKTLSLLGSISAIYNITKNLQFKSSGSLNFMNYNQRNYLPSYLDIGSAFGNVANGGGIGGNSNRRFSDWFLENTLTYNKDFNEKNSLNVLLGQSYETTKASFFSATAKGYPNDNLLTGLSSAALPLYFTGDDPSAPQSYLLSFYLRANYSLLDKYLFTFTGRTDGSSKFGPTHKFGYFPSGAIAWRISKENFLKNVRWIDDIKLRGSYGLTGTQNIGNQMYRTLFSPSSYAGSISLLPTQLGNNNIKWESTKESNAGIDISLSKGRLTATVDYYNKETSGALFSYPVAPSSSYISLLANAVGIKNTGLEIAVAGDIIRTDNFRWNSSLNVTFNKSLVTRLSPNADLKQIGSLSGLETQTSIYGGNTTLIQGQPLGIMTGQIVTGIIKTEADKVAYQKQLGFFASYFPSSIGDPMFKLDESTKANGYQAPLYNQIIGYGAPKYYGGITEGFTYKKFNLQFYFTYSVGGHLLWGSHAFSTQFQGIANANVSILDRYYSGNTNSNEPRLLLDSYTYSTSQLDVFNSSYLKLRTLTFNYNLGGSKWIRKASVKNASFFVSATNLFIITKYPGDDPEVSNDPYSVAGGYFDVSNYPSVKTFSVGIKASF